MSRKFILSIATATLIIAGLASNADARGFGGGFGGGHALGGGHSFGGGKVAGARSLGGNRGRMAAANRGSRGGHPGHGAHNNHHHHRVFRNGIWIDIDGDDDEGYDAPVGAAAAAPGPCTCLTKSYTKDGLVVFADLCTREAASARVDGTAADATPTPPANSKTTPSSAPVDSKAAEVTQQPTSTNFAGRTYADFLAANAQAAPQTAQKN